MLPLDDRLRIGIQTIHRRTEPATGPWLPKIDELIEAGRTGRSQRLRFAMGWRPYLLRRAGARSAAAARAGGDGKPAADTRDIGVSAAAASSGAGRQAGRHSGSSDRGPPDLRRRCRWRVSARIRSVRRAAQRTRRAAERRHHAAASLLERRAGQPRGTVLWPVHRRADAAAAAPARRTADLVRRAFRWRAATHRAAGRRLALLRRHARDVSCRPGEDRCRGARGRTQHDAFRAPGICCSPASTTATSRRSMPRPRR